MTEKEKMISDCVDKFVKSNDDIKKFMSEHFLGQPMLKNEIVFLEKSKYDLLLFQLDEEKMTNNSLKKQIEDMESENYLINMELSNMKNQLDNFKNFKSLGRLSIRGTLPSSSKFVATSKSKKRLSLNKKEELLNDDNINKEENNNSTNNLNVVNNFEDENKKNNTNTNVNANSISNKLAAEIIKMKESLEDLNEDLENKIEENDELQGKIMELEEEITKLNNEVENEKRNNIELKEQIESLYTENDLYEQQILQLSEFKKETGLEIEEFIKTINSLFLANDDVAKIVRDIFDLYNKKCNELFEKNKQHFIKQEMLNKELEHKKETITNLNICIDENNKIINEIIELNNENNNKINNLINNYNSEIEKIKKFYNNILDKNNYDINEINKLCDENNNKINNLNDCYKSDIAKIINFYNSNLNKNNDEINEIINLCDKNNNNINNLVENYNNEMEKLKNFYNLNID